MGVHKPTVRAPSEQFQPHFELTNVVIERLRRIERLDHELLHLQGDNGLPAGLARQALSYNAYGTASMEGNPLSLAEVQSVLQRGPTEAAMRKPDEREILNWSKFMEDLGDQPPVRAVADVNAIHAQLFEGVLPASKGLGKIKDRENHIGTRDGQVIYVPTDPTRAAIELQNALDWYQADTNPPLVRLWLFHLEFEAIHPYLDGNGRLGRALMTLMAHQAGYGGIRSALVDHRINSDRQAYYEALMEAQAAPDNLTNWLHFISGIFEAAYADAVATATVGVHHHLNARQAQVAAWLRRACRGQRRIKFGDVHAAFPHLNRRTLQEDLRTLVAAKFLDKQGERKATTYGLQSGRS